MLPDDPTADTLVPLRPHLGEVELQVTIRGTVVAELLAYVATYGLSPEIVVRAGVQIVVAAGAHDGYATDDAPEGAVRARSGELLSGLQLGWADDGTLAASSCKAQGLAEGLALYWEPDGAMAVQAGMHRGRLHGPVLVPDEAGVLREEMWFRHGEKVDGGPSRG